MLKATLAQQYYLMTCRSPGHLATIYQITLFHVPWRHRREKPERRPRLIFKLRRTPMAINRLSLENKRLRKSQKQLWKLVQTPPAFCRFRRRMFSVKVNLLNALNRAHVRLGVSMGLSSCVNGSLNVVR